MEKPVKILKQPLWRQGLFLFISALITFEAGNCFPDDDIISNSSYEYTRLLYEDEEEARRIQLQQLELTNDRLVKRIKAGYEEQQAEVIIPQIPEIDHLIIEKPLESTLKINRKNWQNLAFVVTLLGH